MTDVRTVWSLPIDFAANAEEHYRMTVEDQTRRREAASLLTKAGALLRLDSNPEVRRTAVALDELAAELWLARSMGPAPEFAAIYERDEHKLSDPPRELDPAWGAKTLASADALLAKHGHPENEYQLVDPPETLGEVLDRARPLFADERDDGGCDPNCTRKDNSP